MVGIINDNIAVLLACMIVKFRVGKKHKTLMVDLYVNISCVNVNYNFKSHVS